MNKNINALSQSSLQTLEVFAFLMADSVDVDNSLDLPIRAKISFAGAITGILEVCTTDDFLSSACDTLLGEDENRSDKAKESFLLEIANITIGNFITELAGAHVKVDLGIPEIIKEIHDFENKVAYSDIETDEVILFQLRLDDV